MSSSIQHIAGALSLPGPTAPASPPDLGQRLEDARAHEFEQRRLVICFTDVVGSTELMLSLGDRLARELLRWHEDLVRHLLVRHGGLEVQHTGDGFMLVFDTPDPAIRFALALQRALERQTCREPLLGVRIGLHRGPVLIEPGRLFGAAVNAAARICAHAQPGEILCSDEVREKTVGIPLKPHAIVPLKGFEGRSQLFQAPRPEGPVSALPTRLQRTG